MGIITLNIARIRSEAAGAAGGGAVALVAATKTQPYAAVREAIAAGVDACGENRVQELLEKNEEGAYSGAPLHFIGHLQKNKVKYVVGICDLIQSVGSIELLRLISARAAALSLVQDVLIELNIAGEASKSGAAPGELSRILDETGSLSNIRVRGLMAIPPISTKSGENRRYFAQMRQLFVDIREKKYNNVCMDFLSMGMSDDYLDAIAEGSNMIRLGTSIFGARNYTRQED